LTSFLAQWPSIGNFYFAQMVEIGQFPTLKPPSMGYPGYRSAPILAGNNDMRADVGGAFGSRVLPIVSDFARSVFEWSLAE